MFFNIVDNHNTSNLKFREIHVLYNNRLTSLKRLELGAFIFLDIAMVVVKLTGLIPENKLVSVRFLQD